MFTGRKLIARYVLRGILPYALLSLFLLTAILFTQQTGRFAELALYADVPLSLAGEIAAALLPNVLILTLPAAVLAGIVIAFARMGSDSEIVAIRAAGVGTWSLLWPALLIGTLASGATAYLHLREAPQAARDLRRAALQGALRKLESPVEPRTFNTEIPGYVIYVRDGDKDQGLWERVFIYAQQPDGSTRVVTARSGRIDSSNERSELVLSDAVALKVPPSQSTQAPTTDERSYVVERLAQLRFSIDTGRAGLLERLGQKDVQVEELDWNDLKRQAGSASLGERREAERTIQRKLALSAAPLVFSLFGGLLGIRVRRGGRGAGIVLSLAIMVVYYLISLLGESLVRSNSLSAITGEWLANAVIVGLSLILLQFKVVPRFSWRKKRRKRQSGASESKPAAPQHTLGVGRWGFPSLLDTGLITTLTTSFVIGFVALVSIFIIFTLFEIWRVIASNHVPLGLVARYLLFLLPLVAVELFPATMLITALITYALLARRSEAIAWWASGQSVYRLMVPGLLFAVAVGGCTWLVQEHLMPGANVKQDALRARIRGGQPRATTGTGRQWLASVQGKRLYSYEFDEQQGTLNEPTIYELDDEGVHVSRVTSGKLGYWTAPDQVLIREAQVIHLVGTPAVSVRREVAGEVTLAAVDSPRVFRPTVDKPSQLSVVALRSYVRAARARGVDVSALALALQRKYVNPFSVVVMAFIGMPLALAFGRRGALVALSVAVAVSVAYWGIGGGFQQLGNHGLLPPEVAAWAPPVIFAAAGIYFLSRVRT
jgi:LPS export ABC transporter permease LptF/LPS export ABC transporter permease LptG